MSFLIQYSIMVLFSAVAYICGVCTYFCLCGGKKDKIDDLTIINCKYGACLNKYKHTSCAICMEDFISISQVSIIEECQHLFHSACLTQWFQKRNENTLIRCPYCRCKINKKDN